MHTHSVVCQMAKGISKSALGSTKHQAGKNLQSNAPHLVRQLDRVAQMGLQHFGALRVERGGPTADILTCVLSRLERAASASGSSVLSRSTELLSPEV